MMQAKQSLVIFLPNPLATKPVELPTDLYVRFGSAMTRVCDVSLCRFSQEDERRLRVGSEFLLPPCSERLLWVGSGHNETVEEQP